MRYESKSVVLVINLKFQKKVLRLKIKGKKRNSKDENESWDTTSIVSTLKKVQSRKVGSYPCGAFRAGYFLDREKDAFRCVCLHRQTAGSARKGNIVQKKEIAWWQMSGLELLQLYSNLDTARVFKQLMPKVCI